MRIVSGQYRGKAIATPPGGVTRPTSDRARQAVFNILEHAAWAPELHGARVVDLFAGSGALGLEALSRGAAYCLFVETDDAARGAIRENIDAMHLFGVTRVHRRDATDLGPIPASAGAPFDIAFLDPPYAKGLGEKAVAELKAGGWLNSGAILMFERGRGETDPALDGFELIDTRDYGAARVLFYKALD
ncbi:16S rRNA (guanine(966)-N(2))-methyltransferase RsmD [Caulobacter sp. RHG1]|uniref:16S rRNA (guanine(966)-N(2))-methyltransferase RsmD n=1 Tax=Caulobacter sp. (strain RHG1) TaxID=2545762 RepID=UPI001554A8EA|nr:16S rRNA (guanine(966)-N(2))-methyltransferase RsmD [Caulobacter sp. RHG1]NQE65267.1 16S rRNA (guanine(966)-N(2))-methyltransferase [Caulobacter sp. RHG1]